MYVHRTDVTAGGAGDDCDSHAATQEAQDQLLNISANIRIGGQAGRRVNVRTVILVPFYRL